jgi:hypothetical protein
LKNREELYLCVGNGAVQKAALKISARREKDLVLSIPMGTQVNFHTSRKGTILHNTTYNAAPRLRRYFVLHRPEITQIQNVEMLKCFELSTSIFASENYPVWAKNAETLVLADPLERNVFVSVLLGPAELIQGEVTRLSAYGSLGLWTKNLAGFEILVVATRTKRVGGDVICDATRYYSEVHESNGIGAYKEDFVYYL